MKPSETWFSFKSNTIFHFIFSNPLPLLRLLGNQIAPVHFLQWNAPPVSKRDLLQLVHDGVVALFPELWHRCLDQEHHHDPGLPAVEHDPAVREPQVQPTAGPNQFCHRRWRVRGRRSDGAGAAAATTIRLSTGAGQQLAAGWTGASPKGKWIYFC